MSKPFDIEIASLTDALDPRCAVALSPRSNAPCDPGAKSFYIETFGCQMNVHDSEKVAGVLLGRGYRAVDDAQQADLLLYNTCSIREKAAQKVFSRLNDFKFAAKANEKVIARARVRGAARRRRNFRARALGEPGVRFGELPEIAGAFRAA